MSDISWADCEAPHPPPPPLSDLFGPAAARRAALHDLLAERLAGGAKRGAIGLMRHLPPAVPSAFAARVAGPLAEKADRAKPYHARLLRTAATLRPDLVHDEASATAFARRWYINTARAMMEFSVVHRLTEPRFTVAAEDAEARAMIATGEPVIVVTVHTGMWEMVSPIVASLWGEKTSTGPWQPQESRTDNKIVAQTRRRMGIKTLPARPGLAKTLYKLLAKGRQSLVILIDEVTPEGSLFPLFGRPVPTTGNLAFALKLAARTGAPLMPLIMTRTGPTQFARKILPPVRVEDADTAAHTLDAIYDAHVRAHLDQWYMLFAQRLHGEVVS
ncbi:MAG: lysophospholipid acyltransferase family protein [Pseudomonadota bacterium]